MYFFVFSLKTKASFVISWICANTAQPDGSPALLRPLRLLLPLLSSARPAFPSHTHDSA